MNRKKNLLFLLFLTFSASINAEVVKLENWSKNETYTIKDQLTGDTTNFIKIEKEFIFNPENYEIEFPYILNIINHQGYSKIYVDDILIHTQGVQDQVHDLSDYSYSKLNLPINNGIHKITIVTYTINTGKNAKYSITGDGDYLTVIKFNTFLQSSLFIVLFTITLLLIFSAGYVKLPENEEVKKSFLKFYITLLVYFFLKYINSLPTTGINLEIAVIITAFMGWYFAESYIIRKHNIWSRRGVILTIISSFTIVIIYLTFFSFLKPGVVNNSNLPKQILTVLLSGQILWVTNKVRAKNKVPFLGVLICFILHLLNFLLSLFYNPAYGLMQLGFFAIAVSLYIDLLIQNKKKLVMEDVYTNKLLDSIEKLKKDITGRNEEIEKLKDKNGTIEREKALLLSTISTTLRTPLSSIIGYGEHLYSTRNIDDVHPIVNEIIIESDKIFQSLNNILDSTKLDFTYQDLQQKSFRFKEIFNNSVYGSTTINGFKNNIDYRSEKNSDKILVSGNPQIYQQLTTNVLKYLISLTPDKITYSITGDILEDGYINFKVNFQADNIEDLEFTSKENNHGFNNTINNITKLYDINFDERLIKGCYSIDFDFQCQAPEVTKKRNNNKSIENPVLDKKLSVLIVEDYKPNLNIVKMHLTKMGCDVYTAENGEEAINEFNREEVDVILMDIKMPIMDGWETTEHIRSTEKGLNTLIVGLTASSQDLDIRHCYESGMDDVMVKPVRKHQLYKKLQSFEDFEPDKIPSVAALRADYRMSKVEATTLFQTSINQVEKQLEVLDILSSAEDDDGMYREFPAIISAALNINAFYYTRLLRNYFDAYKNRDKERLYKLGHLLKYIIVEVKNKNENLFRD